MLEHARSLLPLHLNIRFLDPAFGTGAFYSALLRTFPRSRLLTSVAYEIDPAYGHAADELWHGTPLRLHIADFTKATPEEDGESESNLIVCNPPYVRHQHLAREEKQRLMRLVKETVGLRLNGLSGLYCYFICLAHRWLSEGGLAG
jgi:methylase of polypeptide subunit release factors